MKTVQKERTTHDLVLIRCANYIAISIFRVAAKNTPTKNPPTKNTATIKQNKTVEIDCAAMQHDIKNAPTASIKISGWNQIDRERERES